MYKYFYNLLLVEFFSPPQDFQTYIRQSPLPASKHYTDKGYWKNLIVRSNSVGDMMAIVIMHPQELSQVSFVIYLKILDV